MASSHASRPLGSTPHRGIAPPRTPGPLGINDRADPNILSFLGDTPGPLGVNDYAYPGLLGAVRPSALLLAQASSHHGRTGTATYAAPTGEQQPHEAATGAEAPTSASGSIAVGGGMPTVARIPVPRTNGLCIELWPRGYVPKAGSTSTLFIQDVTGNRNLRLDCGYNKQTGRVDYHWNQKGTFNDFLIADHTPVGRAGEALYQGAKYFRYAGRVLLVVAAAADLYSIAVAKKRWRRATEVAAGWAGAWIGCKLGGKIGAAVGTEIEPGGGTAVGGLLGCVAGGVGGYAGASFVVGETYAWVEETFFESLPEIAAPQHDQK